MQASYWGALLIGIAAGSVCTGITMYLLGFRRVRLDGRAKLIPERDPRPLAQRWASARAFILARVRWFPLLMAAMLLTTALGVGQLTAFSFEQRARNAHYENCNSLFQERSLELRRIGDEDRALEKEDDQLRNNRDDALTALIEALLTIPASDEQRVNARARMTDFYNTIQQIDISRDALYAERAALEQRRHEQPALPEQC